MDHCWWGLRGLVGSRILKRSAVCSTHIKQYSLYRCSGPILTHFQGLGHLSFSVGSQSKTFWHRPREGTQAPDIEPCTSFWSALFPQRGCSLLECHHCLQLCPHPQYSWMSLFVCGFFLFVCSSFWLKSFSTWKSLDFYLALCIGIVPAGAWGTIGGDGDWTQVILMQAWMTNLSYVSGPPVAFFFFWK